MFPLLVSILGSNYIFYNVHIKYYGFSYFWVLQVGTPTNLFNPMEELCLMIKESRYHETSGPHRHRRRETVYKNRGVEGPDTFRVQRTCGTLTHPDTLTDCYSTRLYCVQ